MAIQDIVDAVFEPQEEQLAGMDEGETRYDQYQNPYGLSEYRRMFDAYQSATQDERQRNLEDNDYYHGHQLTAEEVSTLKQRGQPVVPVNRIRTAVNGIVGVYTRGNSDVRGWPRTPGDADAADVATETLRYIGEAARLNVTKKGAFKNMLVEGTCACLITVDNDYNIKPLKIRWEEFFYDPRSREEDFSDARYMGIAKWMYQDDAAKAYPNKAAEIVAFQGGNGGSGTVSIIDEAGQDRPTNIMGWYDGQRNRVLIVELYHRAAGTWHRCAYYGGGILSEGLSPYLDEKGRPSNPIEAQTAYVDRQNNRFGVVRDMKPIQDEINKRRSKLLHILNSAQVQAEDPAAIETDTEIVRKEAARPDGVLPFGWRRTSSTDMSAGQMGLLSEAKNELERMSPNPAILGRQGADTSGRALLARQQAGLVELDDILSGFDDWELRVWKQCWARAKQYWTVPMWIRTLDDEEVPKFVGINQPQDAPQQPQPGAMQGQPMPANDMMGHNGGPPMEGMQPQQGGGMLPGDAPIQEEPGPVSPQDMNPSEQLQPGVLGYKNSIASMDIDIVIRTQPETASLMVEVVKDLKDVVASNPRYAEEVPFDMFIELAPIPRKRQILKMLKGAREARSASMKDEMAFKKAVEHAAAQAKLDESKSKTALNEASAIEKLAGINRNNFDAFGTALEVLRGIHESETPPPGEQPGAAAA